MRRSALALLAASAAALSAGSCAPRQGAADERAVVLVTVPPQAHVVERIAGALVRVETLLDGGADPHQHEPTLDELRAVAGARLWVKVGHPDFTFERVFLDRLLAEAPKLVVVDGSEGLQLQAGDAHVWLSPRQVGRLARRVAAELAVLLPEHAAELEAGLLAFLSEIDALEADLRKILEPARGRWFLVAHPAWGYLAAEHGLEQVAIERGGREPDPKTLGDLIARARAAGLPAVFVEPQFDDTGARTIAREIGAEVVALDPLARDWDANLRRVARALAEGSSP